MMRRVMTAAAAVLSVLFACTAADAQLRRGAEFFPNLPVVNQDGEQLKFYDDLVKDKIVIFMFIYTSCTDICPLTTARMTLVEDKLGPLMGRDFFIVSMTVDPEVDTPEKMKAYSKAFATGPGWTFVTGKPEDIRKINYRLGERSKVLSDHRNEIVLANDVTGEYQRDNLMGDLERVVRTIREMDPKFRDQVQPPARNSAMNTGMAMGHQAGQSMYKKICAPCHTIGVGDKVGPDLRGVTERRDRSWLVSYLRNPPAMTKTDPVARELAARFAPVSMPNMRLSEQDADDLISFLREENAKLVEAMPAPAGGSSHQHHEHKN